MSKFLRLSYNLLPQAKNLILEPSVSRLLSSCKKNPPEGPKNQCKPKDPCKPESPCKSESPCKTEKPCKPEKPCQPKNPCKPANPCAPKQPCTPKKKPSCPPPTPCNNSPGRAKASPPPPKPCTCPPPPKPSSCPPPSSKQCVCPPPPSSCPTYSPAIEGKVAVITGGAVGIGYYLAMAILKNGGKVMLGDVKVDEGKEAICKIIEQFGCDKAAFIKCDVTQAKDMDCLFKAALSEFKQIDIVINNAGILEDQLWDKTVEINIKGVIRGTLLGFHHMRKNKSGGKIVNVASILGHQDCYACPVYCGSKHFVLGFTRSMGNDFYYCQTGVKVMTLCPGVTLSAMVVESAERPQLEGFGDTSKALHEELYKLPTQPTEVCGNHIVPILEADMNGSDWISEGSEVYRVKKVDRLTLRVDDC